MTFADPPLLSLNPGQFVSQHKPASAFAPRHQRLRSITPARANPSFR